MQVQNLKKQMKLNSINVNKQKILGQKLMIQKRWETLNQQISEYGFWEGKIHKPLKCDATSLK